MLSQIRLIGEFQESPMKTFALVASVALHIGALSAIPANDARENAATRETAKSFSDSCKCDVEITEDCSTVNESR